MKYGTSISKSIPKSCDRSKFSRSKYTFCVYNLRGQQIDHVQDIYNIAYRILSFKRRNKGL